MPLSPAGLAEARGAAEVLAEHLADGPVGGAALVVTSDLSRATATARVIADALSAAMVVDSGLREEALGPWEGLTREEAGIRFPERYEDWLAGRSDAFAGREGLDRVASRAVAALHRAVLRPRSSEPSGHQGLVVVTHANTVLALVGRLCGLDRRVWTAVPAPPPGGHLTLVREATQLNWTVCRAAEGRAWASNPPSRKEARASP